MKPTKEEMIERMDNKDKATRKAKWKLFYKPTALDKIIFRFFWQKIIATDYEWDVWCKITAYWYRWVIIIFDVEYFNAKTSPTV